MTETVSAKGLRRHDLVRADPAAWAAWLGTRSDLAGHPHLGRWAEASRPLIVRRRLPGETGDAVPLGVPMPPSDGKRRIGLALPMDALTPMTAPGLADVAEHAPAAWGQTVTALVALGHRHGIAPRPFGALLWQAVTGLTYLSATSDLDLLWSCPVPVPTGLLAGLDAIARAAPMRIDGEILLPDGAGLHWRELHDAPEGGSVLAKSRDRVCLRPVGPMREPPTA
ncbi:malonate decarboxylase holo-[acyl-carrier-protein] synthase [Methylobacterium sp. J-026]|uniref:malonate decarboxylase holo-[acyl-carrier-protein] synthase n=1 Tax=Methylobacterium sp. J-026 TaxID=2836624 RepID=UPI001FBC0C63|nr:malonate decarboxylase holo-[acyl-carrier-protein] synthase [Methylobacterium sp. J-026]MCJ2133511.1 malonate decarboxylase holo-[acyl-carrier-protein] synthase [Methylobacterium sp. J-026]